MGLSGPFPRPWVRAGGAAVVSLLTVGAIAVFGAAEGHPAQNVRLLSGMAWLSSSTVGQVTLLDGSTAEVAAQLAVSSAGSTIEVVQNGSNAYAVDRTTGTVRRVDGATFDLTQPQSPIAGARTGLTVFAGPDVLYIVDSQRGVYTEADPRTVTPRGEPQALAAQLGDGTASMDTAGRLWLVDNATGDLTVVDHGKPTTRPGVTKPGRNILTIASGRPVIVNAAERKVIAVDPDSGLASKTLDVDLRPDDTVQISGSPHAGRVYVVASRGALSICDLDAESCRHTIPLAANSKLGAAVEAASRVFVPDYTTGQVWIIDLTSGKVVGQPQVLTPAGPFQLLAQDGVVFFNDPDTARAGVVQIDGSVLSTAKYDTNDPKKGITAPVANVPPPAQPNGPDQPAQSNQPAQPSQSNQPSRPAAPPAGSSTGPDSPVQPTNPAQPPNPTTDPPPAPPVPDLQFSANPNAPVAGDPVTLGVKAKDGQALTGVKWTFNGHGGDAGPGSGNPVPHTWNNAGGPFLITAQATLPDGRTVSGSTNLSVTKAPTIKVTVATPQNGRVTSSDGTIACPGKCSTDVDRRKSITLTAIPDAGFKFDGWRGAFGCSNSSQCTLAMPGRTQDFNLQAPFKAKKAPTTLTLRAVAIGAAEGTITVSGGTTGSCRANGQTKTCPFTVPDPDDAVQVHGEGIRFAGWTAGACPQGSKLDCLFNVFQNSTVEGTFREDTSGFVWILPLVGLTMPSARQRRRSAGPQRP